MSRCIKYQELIERGEWEKAVRELDAAYEADRTYKGAFYNFGLAFEKGGLISVARMCYNYYLMIELDGYWSKSAEARRDALDAQE